MIIRYDFDRWGYTIIAENEQGIIEEYNAGNDPLESSGVLDVYGIRATLKVKDIGKFARQTAQEMKVEHSARRCFKDREIRSEQRRMLS